MLQFGFSVFYYLLLLLLFISCHSFWCWKLNSMNSQKSLKLLWIQLRSFRFVFFFFACLSHSVTISQHENNCSQANYYRIKIDIFFFFHLLQNILASVAIWDFIWVVTKWHSAAWNGLCNKDVRILFFSSYYS